MSNLVPTNIALPAHLANRRATTAVSLADTVAGGLSVGAAFPKISIRASRFRIVKDGTEHVLPDLVLPTVIVGGNPRLSKVFYKEAFDGSAEAKAPDCYSNSGISPEADAKHPQAALCAQCTHNAWGSKIGPQGQKLKSCQDKKRLAVVAAGSPSGDMYLLEITPSAFKDFAAYAKSLSMRGIALETVITNVSFDASASFPKLTFAWGGFLSEAQQNTVDDRLNDPLIGEITGEGAISVAPVAAPAPMPEPAKPMLVHAAAPAAPTAASVVFGAPPPAAAPAPAASFGGGFGAPAPAPVAPTSKPVKAAAPVAAEPPPAPTAGLTDEISKLLAGLGDDD